MIVIIFGHEHYINTEFRNLLDTAATAAAAVVLMYSNTNSNWAIGTLYYTTDCILDCLSLREGIWGGDSRKRMKNYLEKKFCFKI